MQILVIEDSETQRQLIRGMLRTDERFVPTFAGTLQEGLSRLSEMHFEAIFLDLTLPDSSGTQSCVRVSAAAPNSAIVVLTSIDDEEFAVSIIQHGADDYLVKGDISSALLVRATRYAIERKKNKLLQEKTRDELELRVRERTQDLERLQEASARQQDELAHASRIDTLGEMASGLAHELNQPLMAIIGYTDHALYLMNNGDGDSDRCRDSVEHAGKEAKRAGQIIKRMRRLVTKRSAERTIVDLNQALRETIPLIRPGFHVGISLELAPALPAVSIDRVQIQQVVLNLARNAVHAMREVEEQERELLLRTGTHEAGVFIEVADTGVGIAVEDLDRLFDPFFTRRKNGLGLGLSISRTIVEAHGGRLSVRQNELTGLTFRFTLPIVAEKSSG